MKKYMFLLLIFSSWLFGSMSIVGNGLNISYIKIKILGDSNYAIASKADTNNPGINIIDFSNPANLKIVGEYNTSERVQDIAVYDNYAYLAVNKGEYGLVVLNISNPSNPTFVTKKALGNDPYYDRGWRIAVSHDGSKLTVASGYYTVIYDISNPSNPTKIANLQDIVSPSYAYADALVFSHDDKYLFTITKENGSKIFIFDISNSNITKVGETEITSDSLNIAEAITNQNDSKLYITNALSGGLFIYDINKQANSVNLLNGYNTATTSASNGIEMTADGSLIYFGTSHPAGNASIVTYNVKDNNYSEIFTVGSGNAYDIALSSDEKYILYAGGKLSVIDTDREVTPSNDLSFYYTIKPGWSLLGAVGNINVSIFPEDIKTIWLYNGNSWQLHTNSTLAAQTSNNFGFAPFLTIAKGQGFWVYNASTSDIVIGDTSLSNDINASKIIASNLTNQYTNIYAMQNSLGKTIVMYNTPNNISIAKKDSNNIWQNQIVLDTNESFSATISSNGKIYTTFTNSAYRLSIINSYDGNTWSNPIIVDPNFPGGKIVADGDNLYIAYHEHANSSFSNYGLHLSYSKDGGNTWNHKYNIFGSEAGYGIDMITDPSTHDVYISHGVDNNQRRFVVTKIIEGNISNIVHTIVDENSSASFTSSSIVKVGDDIIMIAYFDNISKTIKLATSNDNGNNFYKISLYQSNNLDPIYGNLPLKLSYNNIKDYVLLAFIEDNQLKVISQDDNGDQIIDNIDEVYTKIDSHMRIDAFFDNNGVYHLFYVDKDGNLQEFIKL